MFSTFYSYFFFTNAKQRFINGIKIIHLPPYILNVINVMYVTPRNKFRAHKNRKTYKYNFIAIRKHLHKRFTLFRTKHTFKIYYLPFTGKC